MAVQRKPRLLSADIVRGELDEDRRRLPDHRPGHVSLRIALYGVKGEPVEESVVTYDEALVLAASILNAVNTAKEWDRRSTNFVGFHGDGAAR
jgi:hypothetical protein